MAAKKVRTWRRRWSSLFSSRGAKTELAAAERTGELELVLSRTPNSDWAGSQRGSRITFDRAPVLRKTDKVFAIGSCFAVEIRRALQARGFDVYPKYDDIDFDPKTQKLGKMPARDNINHYDTFTIRQEFEHAFASRHYGAGDFLEVPTGSKSPFENPATPSGRIPIASASMVSTGRRLPT
jgi:hypothetical protein